MKFGLNHNEYDFILNHVVIPIEKEGAKVFCFGSRARQTHRKFSDLDLMVEVENKDLSKLVSEIRDYLTESNFPYKVDIVIYPEFTESYKPGYQRDKKPYV